MAAVRQLFRGKLNELQQLMQHVGVAGFGNNEARIELFKVVFHVIRFLKFIKF